MTTPMAMAYGTGVIPFEFTASPEIWDVSDPPAAITPDLFRRRVEAFLSQTPLDLSRTAVVIGDKTRLCGYPQYLPVLLDTLAAGGMDENQLTIHVAYGTHPRQSAYQSREAYGSALGRGRWVHHDCGGSTPFIELGRTARGTPVKVPGTLYHASCRITFGAISHHYFAGYGGGRKLIFPGLGERGAIYANHSLFLDRHRRELAAGCQPGELAGNPLAQDLAQVEAFFPAHFAIHGILNGNGQVCDLLVGRGPNHFLTACAQHGRHCEVPGATYDLVLASCGGFPKDINFIQSHKAIHNAAAFVRDDGRLILLAECRDGIGSKTFLPWFGTGSWTTAFDRLAADYKGNGGTALSMMAKQRRIRIALVTELSEAVVGLMGVERLTPAQARQETFAHKSRLAVIPNASMLVRRENSP